MSLVEHSISLDLKIPRSLEPILLFTNNLSAYSISVRVTENGKEKDITDCSSFKLKIEGLESNDYPTGTLVNNKIVFSLAGVRIEEGWSICSVLMRDTNNTAVETQVFQILKQVNDTIQVDEEFLLSLNQSEVEILKDIATDLDNADTDALALISQDDVNKLHAIKTIISITDDADRTNGGSRVDSSGVLHITPKIADVSVNGTSKLSNGSVNILSTDVINTVDVKNSKGGNTRSIGSGTVTSATKRLDVTIDNGAEAVKYNGSLITPEAGTDENHLNTISFDALAGLKVKNSNNEYVNLDGNGMHTRTELIAGTGVALTPDGTNNKLTVAFDASNGNAMWPATQLALPQSYNQGDVLVAYNGEIRLLPLSEALGVQVGDDGVTVNTNIIQSFDFVDFTEANSLVGTDMLPFLHNGTGTKITWANLMSQFAETHRNEYFTKTITASDWGSSQTCNITVSATELGQHNLTAAQVIDVEGVYHSHAHVHPEPASRYSYANYGIYCSNVSASNNDVVFTFMRNSTITTMPSVDVTIEVRIG